MGWFTNGLQILHNCKTMICTLVYKVVKYMEKSLYWHLCKYTSAPNLPTYIFEYFIHSTCSVLFMWTCTKFTHVYENVKFSVLISSKIGCKNKLFCFTCKNNLGKWEEKDFFRLHKKLDHTPCDSSHVSFAQKPIQTWSHTQFSTIIVFFPNEVTCVQFTPKDYSDILTQKKNYFYIGWKLCKIYTRL